MPYFQRVAERRRPARAERDAPVQKRRVAPCQARGLVVGSRQELEELLQPSGVEAEARRQLPENGPELFFQLQHAGRKEIRQARVGIFQSLEVRDEATALERKHEAFGRRVTPGAVTLWPLQRVERAVHLDRVERAAGKSELLLDPDALGIKNAPPGLVAPARDADPHLHGSGRTLASGRKLVHAARRCTSRSRFACGKSHGSGDRPHSGHTSPRQALNSRK
jgi:hypothetical protein